jgi:hypothetical protein
MLEEKLGSVLVHQEKGATLAVVKSREEFNLLGRVISALNPGGASNRGPAATAESRVLAGRYLDVLDEKFRVKDPKLPVLLSSPLMESCRTALTRTLEGLKIASPVIVGTGVGTGLQWAGSALKKSEARKSLRSLCEQEGGGYLSSEEGPGGCRCPSGGGGNRDQTWTWETLGKRDPQARLCSQ